MNKKRLSGASLAGTSSDRKRVENDYYATPPESTQALLDLVEFKGDNFLEPCVGGGHIAEVIKDNYPSAYIKTYDLVDRGFPNTLELDFLKDDIPFKDLYDNVITNPPYKLAKPFVERSLSLVKPKGKVAMFLKIQFLEGQKRKKFFKRFPPKYIYVFSKRQNPWRNGSPVDEKGKPWSSTMCFAWFIWEKGFQGDPVIKWI